MSTLRRRRRSRPSCGAATSGPSTASSPSTRKTCGRASSRPHTWSAKAFLTSTKRKSKNRRKRTAATKSPERATQAGTPPATCLQTRATPKCAIINIRGSTPTTIFRGERRTGSHPPPPTTLTIIHPLFPTSIPRRIFEVHPDPELDLIN